MAKREKKNKPQRGLQPPRSCFFLNPYEDARLSRCPQCPQFIPLDPDQPLLLKKTCRSCVHGDLLIAHQNEGEDVLTRVFPTLCPQIIGNHSLVIGTVGRADWKWIDQNQPLPETQLRYCTIQNDVVTCETMGNWRRK